MKKSGFKKPSYEEYRAKQALNASKPRKPLKKAKTSSTKALKVKLWELCKQIIRKRYGNTCYTCGKSGLSGSSWQTGHFIASSVCGANLRYDLRNLRPQCFMCNINLSGNGAIFYRNLVEREGQVYVDQLFTDKNIIVKADETFYKEKIEEYTKLVG